MIFLIFKCLVFFKYQSAVYFSPEMFIMSQGTCQIACKTATPGTSQAEYKLRICHIGVMKGTIVTLHGGLQPLYAKRNFYLMNTKGSTHELCNLLIKIALLEEESWAYVLVLAANHNSLAALDASPHTLIKEKKKSAFVLRQLQLFSQPRTDISFKSKLYNCFPFAFLPVHWNRRWGESPTHPIVT